MIFIKDHAAVGRIIIAQNADSTTTWAAQELSRALRAMSSAYIWISDDRATRKSGDILLGKSRLTEELNLDGRIDALPREGYFYCTTEENLVIGGVGRGLLYGVYGFLEEVLGCRFFSPEVEHFPQRGTIDLTNLDRTDSPAMEYREPYLTECKTMPHFAARRRVNGQSFPLHEEHGGKVRYADGYFVHTFTKLLPPDEYFDEHPEYYAQVDGQRLREKTQLCLTNPEVLRIVTANVLEALRKEPDAGIFSVSQDDNYNGCNCEKCRTIHESEGSMAGAMIYFVNKVAEAVEKEFPDVVIDTLAYQWTRKPPKFARPRHNVCVRLCSIECCFLHPLRECRQDDPDAPNLDLSQPFADDLIGWGKICDRLYIWDYVTNFSHYWMPHPNFHVLADNIRFFRENGVKGVFEQGCSEVGGGEMTDLRAYLLSKCLWDPDIDENVAIDEFLSGVYGISGVYIKKYLEIVYQAVMDAGCHLYCFNHPDKPWHTMELVERCEVLFDQAEAVALDGVILNRIRKQRMAVRYLRILLTPKGSAERNALLDAFETDARAFGITHIWERKDLDFCLRVLRGEEEPGFWWGK